MSTRSRSSLVSILITCGSVMRSVSTPHGMKCPQYQKTAGTFRPLERGERAKRGGPLTLPELGDLPGQICGESAHRAAAHRPLRWTPGDVSLSVPQERTGRAGNGGSLHVYRAYGAAYVSQRLPTDTLLRGAGDEDF